jgi:hypothetical protein
VEEVLFKAEALARNAGTSGASAGASPALAR